MFLPLPSLAAAPLTVHVQRRGVDDRGGGVGGGAGVAAAVLHAYPRYVDVANHLPVHVHVLPHHQPVEEEVVG